MELFEKCYDFTRAKMAKAMGYYPFFIPFDDSEGTEVIVDGQRKIMIGSNNYLGLTMHPKVREAAMNAVKRFGPSCTGSRFMNGTLRIHEELESRLAAFVGKEAALVFSTGMQTNLGTISALIGRGDIAITDKDDHASIIDGCRLSYGEMKRFRHNDMESLDVVLKSCPEDSGKLVIVDGVYSMGGDLAPLPEMIEVCQKYNARLMVDDAHGIGTVGKMRGTSEHFGVTANVDLIMSTFSKSFASLGGFIAGDEPVIHYIQHHARALLFSASIPASNAAAALAALDVMETEPERFDRLAAISKKMHEGYRSLGYDIGETVTPIIPIIIRDEMQTLEMWKQLYEAGVYTNCVIPPGVAPGMSLLRTSCMATHTDEQMDRVLETFAVVGKKVGII